MYEIKNISKETLIISKLIDTSVLGCRIQGIAPPPEILEPGQSTISLGYEPGVMILIVPANDPAHPRTIF